ncbi:TadE/TadG family type IV pilus assembly protein [Methylocella silvestris]|nr:TadE/TadG family type IV pilus assembly protein [Methylocella silvestris]
MRRRFVGIAAFGRRFSLDRRGAVAIMIGLALPVVIGMVALGTEISFLLYKKLQMQAVADSAALGGAVALQSGHPAPGVEARGISSFLGFVDGAAGVTVAVNNPPTTGSAANNASAVEVIVSQPQTLSMVSLFVSGLFTVGARAVATRGTTTSCVLQLGASGQFIMNNGATANLSACGLSVDSTRAAALSLTGGAQLNAVSVSVVGGSSITGGAAVIPASGLKTSQANTADPYASVVMPTMPTGCGGGTAKQVQGNNQTIGPGVYCLGISFNYGSATMTPGVYFIDRGTFNVVGGVSLTATGVTIILTKSTGSSYANLSFSNGATVNLSAPTSGATAGIAVFGDRNAPASNFNTVTGGTALTVNGAIYLPTQQVSFQNGSGNASACTQLIAATITLTGGSQFQNNCPTGVVGIGAAGNTLVE